VADSHHFDEEQDPDPDPHLSENSDPDPFSHKSDAILLPVVCRPSTAPFLSLHTSIFSVHCPPWLAFERLHLLLDLDPDPASKNIAVPNLQPI
jgi:hypothetical protein